MPGRALHPFAQVTVAAMMALQLPRCVASSREPADGVLAVISSPPGGAVMVDGRYAGTTPLRLERFTGGRHTLLVRLTGFLPVVDTVLVESGLDCTKEYTLSPACTLSVTSEPEGASVYVDNTFRGTTPLVLGEVPPGRAHLAVSKRYYLTGLDSLDLTPGIAGACSLKLRPQPARLRVDAPGMDYAVYLNAQLVAEGPLRDTLIVPGEFELGVKQTTTGAEASIGAVVLPEATAAFTVRSRVVHSRPIVSSLLYPGLGQWNTGNHILGLGLGLAFGGSLVFAITAENRRSQSFSDYYAAYAVYQQASTRDGAASQHAIVQGKYDDARTAVRTRDIGLWTAVGIYLISAVDALLLPSTEEVALDIEQTSVADLSGWHHPASPGASVHLKVKL